MLRRNTCKAAAFGPQTAAWPEAVLEDLEAAGYLCALRDALCAGVQLSTDYSGTGAAEESLRLLVAAAELRQVISKGSGNFTATRSSDQSPECRTVLMMHQGPFRPGCIHGDIGERCDAAIWESLRSRRSRPRTCFCQGLAAFCCRRRRMCPVLASNSSGSPSPSPGAAGARNGSGSTAARCQAIARAG